MKNHGSILTACTTYLVASLPVQVLKVMTLSFTSNSRLVSPRVSFACIFSAYSTSPLPGPLIRVYVSEPTSAV